MLSEGLQIAQYCIVRQLKRGGMGEVYLAEDATLQRQVAIKVIRTDTVHEADADTAQKAAERFLREARIIAQLDHEHILPIFDAKKEIINGTPCMYMVMPFRHEGSFADWLQKREPEYMLPPWDVEHIVSQAADALQNAHNHKIIHHDVKPANFLIHGEAEHAQQLKLQLADFGVSRFMTTTNETQTIRGTPIYMAPEQWEGNPVAASDQYALAIMAYELLTGRPPFSGHNNYQLGYKHCNVAPTPPSTINPTLPQELDDVLLRALAKKPTERFGSIAIFARAFRQALLISSNIHYTLSISAVEARTGTSRLIALTDGKQVTVRVPPGAHDGQVIRLEGQGKSSNYGGPNGALIITLAIIRTDEMVTLTSAGTIEQTVPILKPPERDDDEYIPLDNQEHRSGRGIVLLKVALALTIIAASLGAIFFTWTHQQQQQEQTQETATAIPNETHTASDQSATNVANSNATTTATVANGNATVTATTVSSNATATAITVSGNATAVATNDNATATATAKNATATTVAGYATATAATREATATAIAGYATATATAINGIITSGTPTINDPLQDNSQGYQWDQTNNGSCQFTGGAYHATSQTQGQGPSTCFAQSTNFSNFTYQVQMSIIKGDRGGIVFRANKTNSAYYYFYLGTDQSYALETYSQGNLTGVLVDANDPVIQTNPNQPNLIDLVAKGTTLEVYVNRKLIINIIDSTYTAGQIGVAAEDVNNPTDVAFTNVQVYTF